MMQVLYERSTATWLLECGALRVQGLAPLRYPTRAALLDTIRLSGMDVSPSGYVIVHGGRDK